MTSNLLILAVGFVAYSSFGQGAVVFATRGGGVDAPVRYTCTGERVAGTAYLAQLYYGPVGAAESRLTPVLDAPGGDVAAPVSFATGTLAGYIFSGIGGAGNRYTDPSIVAAGAETAFQVRAWTAVLGDTWEEALYNWSATGGMGKSSIVTARTSTTNLDPPKQLLGLQGFYVGPLSCIPEPNVIALGAIGLVALLWRRRD